MPLDQTLQNKYKKELLKALDNGQIGDSPGQVIGGIIGAVVTVATLPFLGFGSLALGTVVTAFIAGATIGAAIGGVIDPPKPPVLDFGNDYGSPRYGFGALTNTWTNEIPIPILYGELKIAGNVIYQSEPGETVYRCIGLCEGEINSIGTVKINDVAIADLPGCSHTAYTGTSTQSVDSRFSSSVDGLRYLANLAVTLQTSDQLSGGNPTITCVAQGLKVSTWGGAAWTSATSYSRNPVACLRDLLTNTRYGAGMPAASIDTTTWGAAYDYCAEQVQNIDQTAYETRCQLDYIIDGRKPILDIVNDILATFNGFLVFSGNKIKLKVEKDESVAQAFTMANIVRGSFSYSKESKDNLPNRVKVQYIDPDYNYTKIFAQADDPVDQANRRSVGLGEDIVVKEVALLGITRLSQAIRQAKTFLYLSRACGTYCTFIVGPDALACEVGDIITISHDVARWTIKQFRILAIGATKDDKLQLLCREYDSSIYTGYMSGAINPDYGTFADENTPPNDVQDFMVVQDIDILRFTWVAPTPKFGVEIAGYEIRQGASWTTSSLIATMAQGLTYETSGYGIGNLTYWIKAISIEGIYSTNAISDSFVSTLPYNYNAVFSYDEWDPEHFKDRTVSNGLETEWTQDKSHNYFQRIIALKNDTYYWDIASEVWDTTAITWDPDSFYITEQTYTGEEVDVGSEQTAPVSINYDFYDENGLSDITIEWRYGLVSGSLGTWAVFNAGEYTLRYFQFRVRFTTSNINNYMKFINLIVRIDVEDVIDRGTATITDAGNGINITYNQTYTTTPRITVSTRGASPYNPLITASSSTAFTIKLRDPETTAYKTGTVDWHSVGY